MKPHHVYYTNWALCATLWLAPVAVATAVVRRLRKK